MESKYFMVERAKAKTERDRRGKVRKGLLSWLAVMRSGRSSGRDHLRPHGFQTATQLQDAGQASLTKIGGCLPRYREEEM